MALSSDAAIRQKKQAWVSIGLAIGVGLVARVVLALVIQSYVDQKDKLCVFGDTLIYWRLAGSINFTSWRVVSSRSVGPGSFRASDSGLSAVPGKLSTPLRRPSFADPAGSSRVERGKRRLGRDPGVSGVAPADPKGMVRASLGSLASGGRPLHSGFKRARLVGRDLFTLDAVQPGWPGHALAGPRRTPANSPLALGTGHRLGDGGGDSDAALVGLDRSRPLGRLDFGS